MVVCERMCLTSVSVDVFSLSVEGFFDKCVCELCVEQ